MEKFDILLELIDKISEYENSKSEINNINSDSNDFKNFVTWLNQKVNADEKVLLFDPRLNSEIQNSIDNNIARLITTMYRFAKFYFKHALESAPLQNIDEIVYLIILQSQGRMSKSEAILKSVQEKTTGTEILKKMIKNNLIIEIDNHLDKRSKLIEITNQGQYILFQSFKHIEKVSKIVVGDLSEEEKINLYFILTKLEKFHYEIHNKHAQKDVINNI